MVRAMIPDIYWDGEYWCLLRLNRMKDLQQRIKYSDGSVNSLIVDLKDEQDYERYISYNFDENKWLKRLLIKHDKKLLGVYSRI